MGTDWSVTSALPGSRDDDAATVNGHRLSTSVETGVAAGWRIHYGGLAIAGIGFFLTRVVVLTAIDLQPPVRFLVSGGLALVFGLVVILVGVGLSVSRLDRGSVNTVAKWCLAGVLGMAAITGVGVVEALLYGGSESPVAVLARSQNANGLIGGAVGGLLIGVYSVRTAEQRRRLSLRADQATLLNRIIRDKVLNKANVIRANLELLDGEDPDRRGIDTIAESTDRLEEAVREVGFLTDAGPSVEPSEGQVDLVELIEASIERTRERFPDTTIEILRQTPASVSVPGWRQLGTAFDRLLAYAATAEGPITLSLVALERSAVVRVSAPDLSLKPAERTLLTEGTLPEYDDPSVGFDLPIVRLLVSSYGGTTDWVESATSTAITIQLPIPDDRRDGTVRGIATGVSLREFETIALASLVGGIGMGVVLWTTTDTLPAIGGLYGVQSLAVGWLLHLFHSVVFGILFVAVVDGARLEPGRSFGAHVGVGIAYGLGLWFVAAGVVMPVWLTAVGIDTSIPHLTVPSLIGHVTWGGLLSGLHYAMSNRLR